MREGRARSRPALPRLLTPDHPRRRIDPGHVRHETAFLSWIIGSGLLTVVGALAPWATALGVSVSGLERGGDGWALIGLAAAGVFVFFRMQRGGRDAAWWLVGMGTLELVAAIRDRSDEQRRIDQGGQFAQAIVHVGWGLDLCILAAASLIAAGLAWRFAGAECLRSGSGRSSRADSRRRRAS